jgi:hypothetical protein
MRRLIGSVLAICIALSVPVLANGSRSSGGGKSKSSSGSHKSGSSKKSSPKKEKTVHVKAHTKKDGTKVKAHDRRPPGAKKHDGDKPAPAPSPAS